MLKDSYRFRKHMINEKVKCTTTIDNMSCVPNRILLLVHLSAAHLVGLGNAAHVGRGFGVFFALSGSDDRFLTTSSSSFATF